MLHWTAGNASSTPPDNACTRTTKAFTGPSGAGQGLVHLAFSTPLAGYAAVSFPATAGVMIPANVSAQPAPACLCMRWAKQHCAPVSCWLSFSECLSLSAGPNWPHHRRRGECQLLPLDQLHGGGQPRVCDLGTGRRHGSGAGAARSSRKGPGGDVVWPFASSLL